MSEVLAGFICPECGESKKSNAGLASHIRLKHAAETPPAEPEPTPTPMPTPVPEAMMAPRTGGPVKLEGLHRASGTDISVGHRALTMVRPRCMICAPHTNAAMPEWWVTCPHEPYVGLKAERITTPQFGDGPNGSRIVVDETVDVRKFPWPNLVDISFVTRISNGLGPEYKRRFSGFITPPELAGRSQAFPTGVAEMCEFLDCRWQSGLTTYEYLDENGGIIRARYCQEAEAIACYEDVNGIPLEVANARIRSKQYTEHRADIRVVA